MSEPRKITLSEAYPRMRGILRALQREPSGPLMFRPSLTGTMEVLAGAWQSSEALIPARARLLHADAPARTVDVLAPAQRDQLTDR